MNSQFHFYGYDRTGKRMVSMNEVDKILALQVTVAWAGEALCEPPRLGWWKTDLIDEEGGGDLMRRLAPQTHAWASLEAARKAAMMVDEKARLSMAKPDEVRTLFFWGFETDEKIAERLEYHRQSLKNPSDVLPLSIDFNSPFDRNQLESVLKIKDKNIECKIEPAGRELAVSLPESIETRAAYLAAALFPFENHYPAPFFRVTN